jgi:hypothetical protein
MEPCRAAPTGSIRVVAFLRGSTRLDDPLQASSVRTGSLHTAAARIPQSATLRLPVTCAVFRVAGVIADSTCPEPLRSPRFVRRRLAFWSL